LTLLTLLESMEPGEPILLTVATSLAKDMGFFPFFSILLSKIKASAECLTFPCGIATT